jgi:phosphomevalonate kinase
LVNGEDSPGVMKWDAQVDGGNARLPPGLRLVLADVDAGSATPGMARGVLSWRAGNPALAKDLWSRLGSANGAVAAELSRLCSQAAASNAGGARFDALAARIADVRALLREMSTATGVPVEPPAQTALLDDLSRVEGVVGGVVPGAGGFDAVVLLVEEDEAHPGVTERVGAAVAAWNSKSDRPTGAGRVSLLPVRQDDRGVVFENAARYDGWITEMDG